MEEFKPKTYLLIFTNEEGKILTKREAVFDCERDAKECARQLAKTLSDAKTKIKINIKATLK